MRCATRRTATMSRTHSLYHSARIQCALVVSEIHPCVCLENPIAGPGVVTHLHFHSTYLLPCSGQLLPVASAEQLPHTSSVASKAPTNTTRPTEPPALHHGFVENGHHLPSSKPATHMLLSTTRGVLDIGRTPESYSRGHAANACANPHREVSTATNHVQKAPIRSEAAGLSRPSWSSDL